MDKTRIITIEVTHTHELEIDDSNYVVKDYDNEKEMIEHLISYEFSNVLPVVSSGGVVVKSTECVEWNKI